MAQDITVNDDSKALGTASSGELFRQVVEAAKNPEVDAAKMEQMTKLAVSLQEREQVQQFNRDFIAACAEMPVISKTGRIMIKGAVQGTFAKFEDLNRVVKPILDAHNLWITFELGDNEQGKPSCTPILWHRNGYMREGKSLSAPIDSSGSKNSTQGVGSASTYLKRYTMCAALNIVTEGEDDDGTGGMIVPHERQETVMAEAAAAHEQGRYDEWYRSQSPKDRAYMVQSGKHAEWSSEGLLPPPGSAPAPQQAPDPDDTPDADRVALAREQWAAKYIAKVNNCDHLDALAELQGKFKDNLKTLQEENHAIWEGILDAHKQAHARLSGDEA